MFDIRDLEIIAALARHRHFARAAAECGISQPAFSARIKKLELDLGVPLVERGNRYQGLTPEGEIALKWARQMLDAADGLKQSIAAAKGSVSGQLTLGVGQFLFKLAALVEQGRKAVFDIAGGNPELSRDGAHTPVLLCQIVARGIARQRFHAAHAGGHRAFVDQ